MRQRAPYRRDPVATDVARTALRHAERLEQELGASDTRTLDAYYVASDAWEAAGNTNLADHLRKSKIMAITGRGYGYGISPPHGIFVKGATMTYVKAMSRQTGSPFFERSTV